MASTSASAAKMTDVGSSNQPSQQQQQQQQTLSSSLQSMIQQLQQYYTNNDLIGRYITLLNVFNETIEGQLYAYDPQMDMLVLYESGDQHESSKRKTFRIVNIKHCRSISIASHKQASSKRNSAVPFSSATQLPGVNLDKLREREANALIERRQKLGTGVSHVAQQIFDSLSKTLPCKWNGNEILVLESIKIAPPYTLDSVTGTDSSSCERVKKVLKGELDKLAREGY
jgi:small nuclear ribonucleoprotein (snRNP)-like protein